MKKGFTLIELLIVIALISIICLIVVPNIIETRKELLQKSLETKYKNIEAAALEYGMDNLNSLLLNIDSDSNYTICNYVSVDTLISRGYISGDNEDKTILKNPVDGGELNSLNVCINYDISNGFENRIMQTYIIKEE